MIDFETIIRVVADEFDVEYSLVRGSRRNQEISRVRQYCYLVVEKIWVNETIESIAKCFDRDHTTILYGIKKAKQNLTKRPNDFQKIKILLESIIEYIRENKEKYRTGRGSFSSLTNYYFSTAI